MNTLSFVILILLPIAIWLSVTFGSSYRSGWNLLAKEYKSTESFEGECWNFLTGQINKQAALPSPFWGAVPSYGNCLHICANKAGLQLSIFILFRPGHPSLFIPWGDISVSSEEGILRRRLKFTFRKVPIVSLYVSEWVGEEVIKYAEWYSQRAT
jgi:hypothetical protein